MDLMEDKIVAFVKRRFSWIILIIAVYFGIVIRRQGMDYVSGDFESYLLPWYEMLKTNAGFKGLALDFYTYYIPYMCILAIPTYLEGINLLTYIKMISIITEFICALLGGMIGFHLLKQERERGVLVTAVILLSPSIMLNGAFWAQCDYLYVAFVLGSILALMKEHPVLSFVLLGIAFCFKLQTIFVLPAYVLFYLCNRKFSILHFGIIPVVYFIGGLPAVIAGRPASEVYRIYFDQAGLFNQLSMNVPNIWRVFPNYTHYDEFYQWGIAFTLLIFMTIAYFIFRDDYEMSKKTFLMACICSSGICVMFLPGMHERYTALFVLLSYLYFFLYEPKKIYLPFILDLITCITYCNYLFGVDFLSSYPLFAVVNIGILIHIIYTTLQKMKEEKGDNSAFTHQ